MMRLLFIAVLLSIANLASAATLTLYSNKLTYHVGETITLTVLGNPQGATSYAAFGVLRYNGALVDNGTRTQPTLSGPSGPWVKNPLNNVDTNANDGGSFSYAFAQITLNAQTATNIPATPLSTVTLIAKALGIVTVDWDTAGGPTQLDFFGLTNAPGTSFYIIATEEPEPATGSLLGLGLVVLGALRRPRRA
jgi:PEP-CTERM motif.